MTSSRMRAQCQLIFHTEVRTSRRSVNLEQSSKSFLRIRNYIHEFRESFLDELSTDGLILAHPDYSNTLISNLCLQFRPSQPARKMIIG